VALARAGLESAPFNGDGLFVKEVEPPRVGELAAAQGVVLHELTAEAGTLEEAFLELTGDVPTP
jgi:ABC-2 type transport system ATP-binding protein